MNSRDNITVPVKLKLPHPPKSIPPALGYLLSPGVLPYMAGYVACVAGVEKMWGIGSEGRKGVSLGRDGPLSRAFRTFLSLSLPLLSFAPTTQAMGYAGMCPSRTVLATKKILFILLR